MKIDMRSDTVTKPTDAMRKAMSIAEVGDDVFGDDPTINALEELAADKLGKQAALFVPSGTMGNLLGVMTHTKPGQQIILGQRAHIYLFEVSGFARLCGLSAKTLADSDGKLCAADVEESVQTKFNIHQGGTGLLCLENTHNIAGGIAVDESYMQAMRAVADKHGLPIHLDGARLYNAATYLNTDVKNLTKHANSVMVCLSKGLAAPVGSVLCGTKDFIAKARHNRKMLGGGMRQAGILAAAGIIALNEMTLRLEEDHINARDLAHGLANMARFDVQLNDVHTNIVFATVTGNKTAYQIAQELNTNGIMTSPFDEKRIRFTTHYQITKKDINKTLDVLNKMM